MMISYGRQHIDNTDIKSVTKALKDDLITSGSRVLKFENLLKKYVGSKYAISCNSGTSALFMAVLALNLRKNANIIIPAINFIAAANISKHFGYNIFFSDVDKNTNQISKKEILNCIKKNKIKKIDLIFTMHLGGNAENIGEIYKLKQKLKFYVIEDACHSLGSKYILNKKKYFVGNSKHSDITTFSFHPLKTITTGEGGAITTNNKYFAEKVFLLRSHGIKGRKNMQYDVVSYGFNFRLSDLNCALGITQIKKINKILNYRKKLFKYYLNNLNNYKNVIQFINDNYKYSSCHLAIVKINFKKLKISKKTFFQKLKKKQILCQFHYIPQYKFKFYFSNKNLLNAEEYYKNCISLPIHLLINNKQIKYIVLQIKKIIDQCLNK